MSVLLNLLLWKLFGKSSKFILYTNDPILELAGFAHSSLLNIVPQNNIYSVSSKDK